jgi:hypothetical protein
MQFSNNIRKMIILLLIGRGVSGLEKSNEIDDPN